MSNERFSPYYYQELVQNRFLDGRNIILQAPTGAGKTEASLLPGFEGFYRSAKREELCGEYAQRIIYNIPMRSLANELKQKYTWRANVKSWDRYWHPTIQTGENPEDQLFEGRVIFATVDQMLASFLNIPYGLPTKLDNINAGAMIGSYLIFDEFHLYPREQMMLTVLAMLTMLKDVSRFMLMSATFSPVFLHEIGRILGADVIADNPGTPLSKGLFSDITALTTRQRTFSTCDGPLNAQAVLDRTEGAQRVLCVCNTIDRAQQLFQDLQAANTDFECRLLHSRFFSKDRRAHEQFVKKQFENKGHSPVLLVATQVIEVGLDISSDVLLTECAPAASLIQRAGRCARREGEMGRVYVFQPPQDDEGNISYAPYLDEQQTISELTWNALCSDEFNGKVMDFPQEQQLVEIAHSDADKELVAGLENKIDQRIEEITRCMASRESACADHLIRQRDQNRAQLYIYSAPNKNDNLTNNPWRVEALNISKGKIARAFEVLNQQDDLDADFLFMSGREINVNGEGGDETKFHWHGVREKSEIYSGYHFVAHPNVVTYTPETGLLLQPGDTPAELSPPIPPRPYERIEYHAERYHEHIAGLKYAYQWPHPNHPEYGNGLHSEIQYPLRQLCARLNLDIAQAERLLRLTLALHDVGKLNKPWQAWSRAWQRWRVKYNYSVDIPLDDPDPLAHTDYDSRSDDERELQRQLKHAPRGNHAGESAEACLPILWEATSGDQFWMAVIAGAIMRHHTPNVDSAGPFCMVDRAADSFLKALEICGFESAANNWLKILNRKFDRNGQALGNYATAITPDRSHYDVTLMYHLFVRVLRLADQRSGRYWHQYRNSTALSEQKEK